MAELYRRILRFPHRGRGRLALLVTAIAFSFASEAAADPAGAAAPERALVPTESSLRTLAEDLRAENAGARIAAFEALSTLPEGAIPAIEARFEQMREEPVRGEDGYEIVRAFAHAVGSSSAADPVDIAPGVEPVLAESRSLARVRVAERLALLRSLENIGTARSIVAMLSLFAHDFEAFRWEARHIVTRVGRRAGPALVRAAGTPHSSLGAWGKWGRRALGIDDPTALIAGQDGATIVEIIRAYSAVNHMGGIPVVADFVDDDREPVRRAAREAMERFGQNGIWQLRRVMEHQLGQAADLDASWQKTMRALYAGLDARRLAPLNEELDRALERAAEGATEDAASTLDSLLARAPTLPRRTDAAPVYASLGDTWLRAGRWDDARRAYDRALWLDGSNPRAAEWRGSRALVEAEIGIARGAPEEALLVAALDSPIAEPRARARLEGSDPEDAAAEPAPGGARVPEEALAALGLLLLGWPWIVRGARQAAVPLRRASIRFGELALTTWSATKLHVARAMLAAKRHPIVVEPARTEPEPEPIRASPALQVLAPPPAPKREKRRKAARAELPVDLVFGTPATRERAPSSRGKKVARMPSARAGAEPLRGRDAAALDPSRTTSPGTVSALDTIPG